MTSSFLHCINAAGLLLLALSLLGAFALHFEIHDLVIGLMLAQGAVYAGAVWLLLRLEKIENGVKPAGPQREPKAVFILCLAVLMRALLVPSPPVSTDIYRYIWDGRVQGEGINPYRYIPSDPALTKLRDPAIYPNINRADYAHTIYPPMAQMIYYLATRPSESVAAMKLTMVIFEAAGVAAILALLRRRGLPMNRVLLYVWHPLPLYEIAGSGHIDAAAMSLMMLAALAADKRRPIISGALLAGGALVKYFPAVIAPALWRRWDWKFPLAFGFTLCMLYLPYISAGPAVLGFLPAYVHEEGLAEGSGFFLIGLIGTIAALPAWSSKIYLGFAGLILGGLALRSFFRKSRELFDIRGAALLVWVFLIAISPHFPWYFLSAIPFMCFFPSAAFMWLTLAAPLLYHEIWDPAPLVIEAVLYGPFALLLLAHLRSSFIEAKDTAETA